MRQLDGGLAVRLRVGIVDSLSVPFVPLMVRSLQSSIQFLSITSGWRRHCAARSWIAAST